MASLTPYRKDLDVVYGAVDAGAALTENFVNLGKGAPIVQSSDPTASDDSTQDFGVGSMWMNSSSGTLWMCVDATASAAVWRAVLSRSSTELTLTPGDTSAQVTVPGNLKITGDTGGTGLEVSVDNAVGGAVKFRNESYGMQLFIDAAVVDPFTQRAVVQLRQVGSETANRTLLGRTFAQNTAAPDQFKIEHLVNNTPVGTVRIDNSGQFIYTGTGNIGLGVGTPMAKLHSTGSTILGAANSAAADADLSGGQVNISVDQTNNLLKFKVKYSNGTVKSGSVSLS
ncbi:MAG: hypothetical protein R3C18_16170 [Planctomycetaceae bacterium]